MLCIVLLSTNILFYFFLEKINFTLENQLKSVKLMVICHPVTMKICLPYDVPT